MNKAAFFNNLTVLCLINIKRLFIFSLVIFYLISTYKLAFSQKEVNIWHYGYGGGLDFNSGSPVPISGGKVNTQEGCASIADKNSGQLLFYTDGITVWDRTHTAMPNGSGLTGDPSSTQSGIIVPFPNDNTKFYVFSVGAAGNGKFAYSIVDMTLNGGKGNVTTKDQQLLQNIDEKIIAAKQANNKDYWVLTSCTHNGNEKIYAYPITSAGVGSPVINNIGIKVGWYGYMKVSPDGTKLSIVSNSKHYLFDFDAATGKVSNPLDLSDAPNISYGTEFSPDNTKVYVTGLISMYQYDLCATDIKASRVKVSDIGGGMQNGPDGKIYVADGNGTLSIINKPNLAGLACNVVQDGGVGLLCGYGVPTFITSYFKDTTSALVVNTDKPNGFCQGDSATLTVTGGKAPYTWSPATGLNKTTGSTIIAKPVITTTYTVKSSDTLNTACGSSSTLYKQTIIVNVNPMPIAEAGDDITQCAGGSAQLNASGGTKYKWKPSTDLSDVNIANPVAAPTVTTTYYVTVSNQFDCSSSDSVVVYIGAGLNLNISKTADETCGLKNGGASVVVNGGTKPITYKWSSTPQQTDSILKNVSAGKYYITVTDKIGCTGKDSVIINGSPAPTAIISSTSDVYCGKQNGTAKVVVTSGTTPYKYLWNTIPPQDSSVAVNLASGSYTVTVTDSNNCTVIATAVIKSTGTFQFSKGATEEHCDKGDGIAYISHPPDTIAYSYLWSNGQISDTINNLRAGTYKVTITRDGCVLTDSVIISSISGPKAVIYVNPETATLLNANFNFTSLSQGASTWSWDFGDNSYSNKKDPSHSYENTGTYKVTLIVSDPYGCIDSTSRYITVTEEFICIIPSAFTPDEDGLNDLFGPVLSNFDISSFEFWIFDRWGATIFYTKPPPVTPPDSKDPQGKWDGKFEKKYVQPGVYVFKIKVKETNGHKHLYIGSVTLVK
ncbi:MAG: gliding motility-associated C-terminal domain-containing protein [Bacteroidales bacterium]|nr:gliding motility-associated C-terminal domain-containing protein [Bacteroidales bacterium]